MIRSIGAAIARAIARRHQRRYSDLTPSEARELTRPAARHLWKAAWWFKVANEMEMEW